MTKLMEDTNPEILLNRDKAVLNYMTKIFEGYSLEDAQEIRDKLDCL